jgi:hypothetical protein
MVGEATGQSTEIGANARQGGCFVEERIDVKTTIDAIVTNRRQYGNGKDQFDETRSQIKK